MNATTTTWVDSESVLRAFSNAVGSNRNDSLAGSMNSQAGMAELDNGGMGMDWFAWRSLPWIIRVFKKEPQRVKETNYKVEEFFALIKGGSRTADRKVAEKLQEEIIGQFKRAQRLGQKNLLKELGERAISMKRELSLVESVGPIRFVLASEIAALMRVGIDGRSVRSESLERYKGQVPEASSVQIQKAKALGVFDEILILYTRKKETPVALDPKRKEKNQEVKPVDPIAFGAINALNRLYFITDWVDDECELTMDKLEKSIKVSEIK